MGLESKEHDINNKRDVESPLPNHHASNGMSFERILVAYDGTEISKTALGYASYLSNIANSEIVIINVIEDNTKLDKALPITIKANISKESIKVQEIVQLEKSEDQSEEIVLPESLQKTVKEITTACKDAGLTKEITYKIGSRDPAGEIIKVSKLMHFDLIIMGSKKISSKIGSIGSTTRKVVSTLKIPILIVQRQSKYKDEY